MSLNQSIVAQISLYSNKGLATQLSLYSDWVLRLKFHYAASLPGKRLPYLCKVTFFMSNRSIDITQM